MIFDSLKNSALYYPVSPRLEKAFGFIASTDWETMEPGIHELDGKDIYVNVMEPALKKPADAKLEIHDAYIDIQVLIRGEQETFGWSERADLRKPLGEFDAGKDIQFFDDEPQTFYTLRPGQFTILFPEDGHAPMIGEGDVRYNEVFEQVAAANKSKVIYAEKVFSCQECGCREGRQHFCMHRVRDDRNFEVDLDLTGNYQRHNILTAAATVDFLHEETPLTISRRAFLEGTRDAAAITSLAGRWQKLGENPLVVCDTGHNPHGIAYVAEQLKATPHKELYCVIGFVRDKDLAHILPLLPRDAHYIFTQAQTERALPAAELTAKAAIYGLRGETIPEVPAAVAHARELAAADDMVFIGGSTYVVAEAL